MKRWLVALGALTLVGCSDGDVKEESVKTEETKAVEDTQVTTQTATQQKALQEERMEHDTVIAYNYIQKLEQALETYIDINQAFSDVRGDFSLSQAETLAVLIIPQQLKLEGDDYSITLYDKEYEKSLEGYHESMLNSYKSLANYMNTLLKYNQGLVSDKSYKLSESAYDISVDVVSVMRDNATEYHNSNYVK